MFSMDYATEQDRQDYFSIDNHLPAWEYASKVRDKRCYLIRDDDKVVGVMRYNLFWDSIPFLAMIHLDEAYRGKGFGRQAMQQWENELRERGFNMVITSTQVDELAQHFYRKLGYVDKGGLFLDNTPIEQPQELFMIKIL